MRDVAITFLVDCFNKLQGGMMRRFRVLNTSKVCRAASSNGCVTFSGILWEATTKTPNIDSDEHDEVRSYYRIAPAF